MLTCHEPWNYFTPKLLKDKAVTKTAKDPNVVMGT